ncbi:hypothetical protein JTB14_034204 [Gonioctena quinquepunctata]|nr:hypothetical protein JTB14_034204 [Gonioctena quinquepunctata]
MEKVIFVAVCLLVLSVANHASPLPDLSRDGLINNHGEDGVNSINSNAHEIKNLSDEEDMETANMIIFQPLFAYRKKQQQKYRINRQGGKRMGYYYHY